MKKVKLDPPDLAQCQAEILEGSFMTLGPRKYIRCTAKPVVIAKETKAGSDGQKGSMSLCESCRLVFIRKMGVGCATFRKIK